MAKRAFTEDEIASALARLRANGNNAKKTAIELGISRSTLRGWAGRLHPTNGTPATAPAPVVDAKAERQANRFDEITDKLTEKVLAAIDTVAVKSSADVRHLLVGSGITTEKASFSRGGPTTRTENVRVSLIDPDALRDPELKVIEGGRRSA